MGDDVQLGDDVLGLVHDVKSNDMVYMVNTGDIQLGDDVLRLVHDEDVAQEDYDLL